MDQIWGPVLTTRFLCRYVVAPSKAEAFISVIKEAKKDAGTATHPFYFTLDSAAEDVFVPGVMNNPISYTDLECHVQRSSRAMSVTPL